MIASHRTPATFLMSVGGFLFLTALAMTYIFRPDIPEAVLFARRIMLFTAAPAFVVGSCIYTRGIGYPFWLGIFGITLIGLLILMCLPDRYPEHEDTDS
jgi:hypothetical protein